MLISLKRLKYLKERQGIINELVVNNTAEYLFMSSDQISNNKRIVLLVVMRSSDSV